MTELGVIIAAATVTILVAEFFSKRRYGFPAYGWMGFGALAAAEFLMLRHVEPVATYFTPIVWSSYILVADGAVFALRGRSRITEAPKKFLHMALLSVPLWLIFEGYNLRLANWTYVGVPISWPAALLGYGWSFATITPGIFETADLIQALLPQRESRLWKISRRSENILMLAGALCLLLPLVLPQRIGAYLFGLVWLGFVFLLDPWNRRHGYPSFLGDFAGGNRTRFWSFLLSGWTCGWLWEFWNYWAAAKWHYIFPMGQSWKIFEMPALGYLGFLPFAPECFAMYVSAVYLLDRFRKALR